MTCPNMFGRVVRGEFFPAVRWSCFVDRPSVRGGRFSSVCQRAAVDVGVGRFRGRGVQEVGWTRVFPGVRRWSSSTGGSVSQETRCPHCFITFATAAELRYHQANHCFPDDPDEVLRRFPVGSRVSDTVQRGSMGTVVGPASNPKFRHAKVSVQFDRDLPRTIVANTPISRLEIVDDRS